MGARCLSQGCFCVLLGTILMSLLPQEVLGVTRCSPFFQEEREKRRLEQLERKKELQRLLEEEDSKLKGKSPKQVAPGKVTRAQIEESIRKDQQQKENTDTGWGALRKDPRRGKGRGDGSLEGTAPSPSVPEGMRSSESKGCLQPSRAACLVFIWHPNGAKMQPPGSLRRGAGLPSWRSSSPALGTRAEVSQLSPQCFWQRLCLSWDRYRAGIPH